MARRRAGAGADLRPPSPGADPREALRWSRRAEIAGGLLAIVLGLAFFHGGWPRWVMVGLGIFSLLPWVGPAAILRRAERDPSILISDPERRRQRSRRFLLFMVPLVILVGGTAGYIGGGWGAAAFGAAAGGASGALGAWLTTRWAK